MGRKLDSCFVWYDPRTGWDKDQFTRHIFALDHEFKLFSDGRLYHITGELPTETLLPEGEFVEARTKLSAVIEKMMQAPLSEAARLRASR